MKSLSITICLLIASIISFAQSERYQKGMEKNIAWLDSAKTPEEFQNVSAAFERIGEAEKTQWLPYYYAALALEYKGFVDTKGDRDQIANQAEALITKAEAIEPKNAELYLLKNMAATLRMLVDPMNRWQQYGAKATEALNTAKQIDPNNPRIYLMEGQSVMNTPAQFGGGKDKAKVIFEKSIALYKTFQPATSLHPSWGQKRAESLLQAVSK